MKVELINISLSDLDKDKYVYIGRGSVLGNPWSHKKSKYKTKWVPTREESIEKFREWIISRMSPSYPQYRAIEECVKRILSEKTLILGCFCAPLPCHGEVIAELILERAKQRENTFHDLFGDS